MPEFRDIIRIVEGGYPAIRSGSQSKFLAAVRSEAATYLGVEEEDEITASDVRDWLAQHRSMFSRKQRNVFRVMRLPETFITNLKPGEHLGNHWSFNFNPHNINEFDVNGNKDTEHLYLFEAVIDAASIALPLTVAYNCLFPHEEEVFLHAWNGSISLQSIRQLDGQLRPGNANLRADLVNARFGA